MDIKGHSNSESELDRHSNFESNEWNHLDEDLSC